MVLKIFYQANVAWWSCKSAEEQRKIIWTPIQWIDDVDELSCKAIKLGSQIHVVREPLKLFWNSGRCRTYLKWANNINICFRLNTRVFHVLIIEFLISLPCYRCVCVLYVKVQANPVEPCDSRLKAFLFFKQNLGRCAGPHSVNSIQWVCGPRKIWQA